MRSFPIWVVRSRWVGRGRGGTGFGVTVGEVGGWVGSGGGRWARGQDRRTGRRNPSRFTDVSTSRYRVPPLPAQLDLISSVVKGSEYFKAAAKTVGGSLLHVMEGDLLTADS